jgi:hypothetical protein
VIGDRPAQHDPAERVEDDRQKHPALCGGVLGDVRDPQPIGFVGVEAAVDQIIWRVGVGVAASAAPAPPMDPHDAVVTHQTLDAFAAVAAALPEAKLSVDPG